VDNCIVGRYRWSVALAGLCFAAPLVVACFLRPNPAGHGTHQQLGLPPCSFIVLFGIRCPTCGMTTAWACAMHGRWGDALRANVGGTLLCLIDIAVVGWLAISAGRGRWIAFRPHSTTATWLVGAVVVVAVVDWIWRFR
jgi:hypothetical protein